MYREQNYVEFYFLNDFCSIGIKKSIQNPTVGHEDEASYFQ